MTRVSFELRCRDVSPALSCEQDGQTRSLLDLGVGEEVVVSGVCDLAESDSARRLYDLGFAPNTLVSMVRTSPFGGPRVYRVADYEVALRASEARCIRVEGTR